MPEQRSRLLARVVDMIGSDVVTLEDAADGWPGKARVRLSGGFLPVAIHIGPIGGSQRGRDNVERRFQNPGGDRPLLNLPGRSSLLVGVWEEASRPVLVLMDAEHRIGATTRQSFFVPLPLLQTAERLGWAEGSNARGERITAFHPALLPTVLEADGDVLGLEPLEVAGILAAAGLVGDACATAAERARRATTQLVRDSAFRAHVLRSYGERCAMCGFNFGLVTGAHIYPATAPSSPDAVWNGLALCSNHHAAFDRHLIHVDPASRAITLAPQLVEKASLGGACRSFVETTFPIVKEPTSHTDRPREEMFVKRYAFFTERYDWAS